LGGVAGRPLVRETERAAPVSEPGTAPRLVIRPKVPPGAWGGKGEGGWL